MSALAALVPILVFTAFLVFVWHRLAVAPQWGARWVRPVVGIVLGFLVLSEPIGPSLIVGTALVTVGVAIVNGPWGRRRLFTTTAPVEPA